MDENQGKEPVATAPEAAPVVDQAPVATNAPQAPQPPAPQLPVETKDRTKQEFDKLLENNRRLFETNELFRQELENRNAPSKQTAPSVPVETVNPNDFVERDPITGERVINEQRLKSRLEELQARASKAEQSISNYMKQSEDREIDRQERETFASHPELNYRDQNKFDPEFNRLVRATLTDSFTDPEDYGGRNLGFKEAADLVRSKFPKASVTPVAPVVDTTAESKAAQEAKEQSSAQVQSQPRAQAQQTQSDEDALNELKYRTRYLNDDKALAERIKFTEHILPKDGSVS